MEKTKSATSTTNAKPPFIPNDILTDIFRRLPDKVLCRLKSVSKPWSNLCSSITPLAEARPGLLSLRHKYSGSQDSTTITIATSIDDARKFFSFDINKLYLEYLHDCNGLILLNEAQYAKNPNPIKLFVCNPFMNQLVEIQTPPDITSKQGSKEKDAVVVAGLAYDGRDKHYKVVLLCMVPSGRRTLAVYDSRCHKWDVLLVSKVKWASTGGHPERNKLNECLPTLYWRGCLYWVLKKSFMLVLDIKSKEVKVVQLPQNGAKHIDQLWTYKGMVLGIQRPAKPDRSKKKNQSNNKKKIHENNKDENQENNKEIRKLENSYTLWELKENGGSTAWDPLTKINVGKSEGTPVGYSDEHGVLFVKMKTGEVRGYDFEGKVKLTFCAEKFEDFFYMKEVHSFKVHKVNLRIAN